MKRIRVRVISVKTGRLLRLAPGSELECRDQTQGRSKRKPGRQKENPTTNKEPPYWDQAFSHSAFLSTTCRHADVIGRSPSSVPFKSLHLAKHTPNVLAPPILSRKHREMTCIWEMQVSQNAFRNNQRLRQRRRKLPTVIILIIL